MSLLVDRPKFTTPSVHSGQVSRGGRYSSISYCSFRNGASIAITENEARTYWSGANQETQVMFRNRAKREDKTMKIQKILLGSMVLAALCVPVVRAQSDNNSTTPPPTIQHRKENQQDRIANGVQDGHLRPAKPRI